MNPDPISAFETAHILAWRIAIINGMIKENPESTIMDYLILLYELEQIEITKNYRKNNL